VAYTVAAVIALSVVAGKDDGLGGHELTTPVTRVLVATAVMALATVLALNISAANSGFALLGRVVVGVVVGALAFVGTTVALATREARRAGVDRSERAAEHPETIEPPPAPSMDGPVPAGAGPDGPRQRAAHSSIRLITPDAGPPGRQSDDLPPIPFRGRLDEQSGTVGARHLRPVPQGREDARRSGPGGGRTIGGAPVEDAGAVVPPEDEEEPDGPDPGGSR
jgi:hypothetical protein